MKVKLLKGNDLQRLENLLNDFISDKKIVDISLYKYDVYIFLVKYYDIL